MLDWHGSASSNRILSFWFLKRPGLRVSVPLNPYGPYLTLSILSENTFSPTLLGSYTRTVAAGSEAPP